MTGLELIALHGIGDFVLQNGWMARNKLGSTIALLCHVLAYTSPFALYLWLSSGTQVALLFCLPLALTHVVIDSRRWMDDPAWPPRSIIIDQVFHIVVLAALQRFLFV